MLGSDLTYKQFLFCEEYLRTFNAFQSFKKAYPNCKHRGETNIMKSRKVIAYIKERLEQKKATVERLTDTMHEKLLEHSNSPDSEVSLEATKQIARIKEIELRMNELEARMKEAEKESEKDKTINITIGSVDTGNGDQKDV